MSKLLLLKNKKKAENKKVENIKDLIPKELIEGYTMNNTIPIIYMVMDGNNDLHKKDWTHEYLDSYINRFTIDKILKNTHGEEPYNKASFFICSALKNYNLEGKKVAIIGSTSPWIEAIVLNHGCTDITTVEYNKPNSFHPYIKTIEYNDFIFEENKYDYIISYSSIEHSGLGRYGDPLNPDADIETMNHIYKSLVSDGILFWGAPVGGSDVLTWNAHRVYGKIRLPVLFKNFKIIKWYGLDKNVLEDNKIYRSGRGQPVIVSIKN
jgi:hypothetical protein